MIVFDLRCEDGHTFEGWFASSSAYDEQTAAGTMTCPECGTSHISKAISAPRVNGGASEPAGPCGMPCSMNGCQISD
jgi:hypothetical protein